MPGPFIFRDYGTFTGPGSSSGSYDYDLSSAEVNPAVGGKPPEWSTDLPTDTSFKLTDLAVVLFHAPGDYVGFYSPGASTQVINLAHSTGEIPLFNIQSKNTIHSGKIIVNDSIICNGAVLCNVTIDGPTIARLDSSILSAQNTANSKKSFDIPHPTKENHRLRYICLEGPQAEVYLRGKLINQSVIELPDYWRDLVDAETIGVTLTSVGSYQELYVEKVGLGTHITIKNSAGGAINCTYVVYGERKDTSRNIPEYEGTSPKDYPGDNREYSINYGQDWLNLRGN